jgi:sec-independent protein translocase protein TatA
VPFNLGGPEIVVIILIIVILFFGAKKIPELAKGLGRAMGEFKRGRAEVDREMQQEAARNAADKGKKAPAPQTKPAAADSDVVKAAKALGIDTEGKTEEELKEEIARAMKKTD